jgi:hypothetical protein
MKRGSAKAAARILCDLAHIRHVLVVRNTAQARNS